MKADLAPKHDFNIDENTVILWFQKSNRYVVVSESIKHLIDVFLDAEDESSFVTITRTTLKLDHSEAQSIYNELLDFLESSNRVLNTRTEAKRFTKTPDSTIQNVYSFNGVLITINYKSERIKSLIHPQICHHVTDLKDVASIQFDIFNSDNDLFLFKNNQFIGNFKTSEFHLLQGRFALELTNSIFNLDIDEWIATFHASTITNTKEAIMIIGDSGNGKSTLSALLMANGLDLLSDDFTPMYQDFNLYRYPAAISVKEGAFQLLDTQFENFNKLQPYINGIKKIPIKYLPPNTSFKNSIEKFPCHKIVKVKFDPSQPSQLKETVLNDIIETLIPDAWISPKEPHALKFLKWLQHLKCYELNYSNNDFALAKFKTLFNG